MYCLLGCKSRSHSCTCSEGEMCSSCSSNGDFNLKEQQQQLLVDSNGQFPTEYRVALSPPNNNKLLDSDSPLDEKAEWAQVHQKSL